MERQRLELLMKRLDLEQSRANPTRHFDMDQWASRDAVFIDGMLQLEPECGTTACAAGLATTVPELRAAGLRLEQRTLLTADPRIGITLGLRPSITFGPCHGFEAVERFFDLSQSTARWIFSPGHYTNAPQPIDVADRIRELLIHGEPT